MRVLGVEGGKREREMGVKTNGTTDKAHRSNWPFSPLFIYLSRLRGKGKDGKKGGEEGDWV